MAKITKKISKNLNVAKKCVKTGIKSAANATTGVVAGTVVGAPLGFILGGAAAGGGGSCGTFGNCGGSSDSSSKEKKFYESNSFMIGFGGGLTSGIIGAGAITFAWFATGTIALVTAPVLAPLIIAGTIGVVSIIAPAAYKVNKVLNEEKQEETKQKITNKQEEFELIAEKINDLSSNLKNEKQINNKKTSHLNI